MDSGIGMKKRMAQLAAAKKKQTQQKKEVNLGINDCDIGASPQMQKGAIFNKKDGGGGKSSPLHQASKWSYGKRKH